MHLVWPAVVFSLLINVSLQLDESHPKKQSTDDVELEKRAAELVELYSIYPKDATVKTQADAINQLLDQYVLPANKTDIYASECNRHGMWTLFWNAPLTESKADILKQDPNIGYIGKSNELEYDPTLNYAADPSDLRRQKYAAEEMKFLSQPPELSLPNFEHYVYEESAGRGVNVYISDTGANLANQELTDGSNVAGRVRWLFGQGGGPINTDQVDLHIDGHGTCMLDKIGGYRYGVAKNVNPIVARAVHNHPDAFLDTVRQIDADYEPIYNQDPRTARAIINMSWGFPADQLRGIKDAWVNELRTLMQKLISMGATIVIPSGNAYPNKEVDKWPALFAREEGNNGIPELIIVGGIEVYRGRNGKLWDRSQTAPFVSVYAPSFIINCADGKGGMRNRLEVTAAAQVSGMGAYFLGIPSIRDYLHDDNGRNRVTKLKDHILRNSWVRDKTAGDFNAIYNNEDPRTCKKPPSDDDDEVAEPCQVTTTTTGANDVTVMGDCFIDTYTTVTPTNHPTPTPELQCSCAGAMVAGVASTEVMGTTYTWCQTSGPPVYPTGMQTVVSPPATAEQVSPPEPTVEDPTAPPPGEPAPGKPEGKCNSDDASPLNVGNDC
ncbi:MAG: hypothetical protein Q9198_000498 [Flavoplaca austrocitrina]